MSRGLALRDDCIDCKKPLPLNNRHHKRCGGCWIKNNLRLQRKGLVPYGISIGAFNYREARKESRETKCRICGLDKNKCFKH